MTEFQIRRDGFTQHRVAAAADDTPLADTDIRVKIERFGFTANNVTYAVAGDHHEGVVHALIVCFIREIDVRHGVLVKYAVA